MRAALGLPGGQLVANPTPAQDQIPAATLAPLIAHAASALDWALASLGERDGRGDTPFEWLFEFGRWLGRLCVLLPASEIRTLVIARVDAAVRRAADEVMAALQRANAGLAPAYGGDALTRAVEQRFAEVFDHEVAVFFVATGGAANGLALSALTPPWGMVLCHEESHIQMDECAGPEFFTGGAKLLPMPGDA